MRTAGIGVSGDDLQGSQKARNTPQTGLQGQFPRHVRALLSLVHIEQEGTSLASLYSYKKQDLQ